MHTFRIILALKQSDKKNRWDTKKEENTKTNTTI